MASDDVHYPNLQFCSIIPGLSSGTGPSPSVAITAKCLEAMSKPIPAVYDFEIEKSILEKQVEMEASNESPLMREPKTQRNDVQLRFSVPQRDMLRRMKSVTNASDDVCASLLMKKGFNLNNSIESYFSGER